MGMSLTDACKIGKLLIMKIIMFFFWPINVLDSIIHARADCSFSPLFIEFTEWMETRSYKECIFPTKLDAEPSEPWLQFTSNGGQQLGAVTASISSY